MINIKNLSMSLEEKKILDDINIEVIKGSVYGLVGKNGAGKTTLINCISGIYRPTAGLININGQNPYNNHLLKQKIAYIPDEYSFNEGLKSNEIIYRFMKAYDCFDRNAYERIIQLFELDDSKPARSMSKGMKTQLMLALKLATHPEILLMDEPTNGLDPLNQKIFFEVLVELLLEQEMTVFISSHYIEGIEKICDCVGVIEKGKMIFEDSLDHIKDMNWSFIETITDTMKRGYYEQ
ncbi:MAG: ABC transporter ATP-binding protein [Clostridia bacterium]|nr:ABC transporter ATP-binding protein [Clostridia bacterium]